MNNSTTYNKTLQPPTAFYIGGDAYNVISSNIQDVRLYNRALSAAEVQALYNAER